MRELPSKRPSFQRSDRESDFDKSIIRIIQQMMNPEAQQAFIRRLTNGYAPDVQVRLYAFAKAMICSWAGDPDLSREDAGVIEDCRKICDVMGWAFE